MEFCTLTLQIRKKDEEPAQLSWNSSTCYQVTLMLLEKKLSVDYTVIDKAKKNPTKLRIAKVRHSQRVNEAFLSLFGLLLVSYLCTLLWL